MDFKCYHNNLVSTSFTHVLNISSTDTVVWYLQVRYFVVSLQLLNRTIQGSYYAGTRTSLPTQPPPSTPTQAPLAPKPSPAAKLSAIP